MSSDRVQRRRANLALAAATVSGAGLVLVATVASAGAGATSSPGTVITTTQGAFGTMLDVGSGKYAGYTLYFITSDTLTSFGCTNAIVKSLPDGPGSCTGPSNDKTAEWPAITTTGAPVAGPGVSASLLRSVSRPGIGDQVTYAGHPLYLFDEGPGQLTGEEWDEATLPPWHGVWYLISPSGLPLPWPASLTTTTIGAKTVLAAAMLTGDGWEPFPVYSFSKDSPSASACTATCAMAWPPLITSGKPGTTGSVFAAKVAVIKRADGTSQVTYGGHPLYLFAYEGISQKGVGYAASGDGNGLQAFSGVFKLVTP